MNQNNRNKIVDAAVVSKSPFKTAFIATLGFFAAQVAVLLVTLAALAAAIVVGALLAG